MLKIKKCSCACCGSNDVSFIFGTNSLGSIETSSDFTVRATLDSSKFKDDHKLTTRDMVDIVTDSTVIDLMCIHCMNENEKIEIEVADNKEFLFEGLNGKDIMRYLLSEEINMDMPLWTMEDLEAFMVSPRVAC